MYEYVWTDGAKELALVCRELKAAHDTTVPGNKRQNAVAERTNWIIQDGTRALLMTAGLPVQFWVYACSYFAVCCNAQPQGESG